MRTPARFVGRWRITESELWDAEALDMLVPAHITFSSDRLGHFEMIAVRGGIDVRFDGDRVEFSWVGDDDGSETGGRGWAELESDGRLAGRIYFHQGDDSGFVAAREGTSKEVRRPRRASRTKG